MTWFYNTTEEKYGQLLEYSYSCLDRLKNGEEDLGL
jgi:hypothetical protein